MRILHIIILSLLAPVFAEAQNTSTKLPKSRHKFIVIAHRGDHTAAPENTLAAYQHAIDAGVDYIEIDLRTTKDSQLVIMHDANIDRMTNGKGKIKELNLSELNSFQIQEKSKPEWGLHSIPHFEDVLKLAKNKINIYLDFKDADVAQTYKILKKYKMTGQVVVYINHPDQAKKWMEIAPSMPLIISLPGNIRDSSSLTQFLQKMPVAVLDGSYKEYNRQMIQAAHNLLAKVWPDIQHPNEAEFWESALATDVDGLQTDHPETLIKYLKNKGIR